jgi:Mg-chelatase subunit ChlD
VVSVSLQQRVEQELTESKSQAASAISRIRLDRVDPLARYTDWIGKAQQLLEKARTDYGNVSPIEVIVVYSTGCPDVQGADQYCNRQVASAGKAKGLGMTVVGVCKKDVRPFGFPIGFVMGDHCRWLRQIGSNGFYYDLRQAPSSAKDISELGRESFDLGLDLVQLTEVLPPGVEVVPGSLSGSASITPTQRDGQLRWEWPDVQAGSELTATWTLSPTVAGLQAVRGDDSRVQLVDNFGRWSEPAAVPERELEFEICVGPTATPTPVPPTVTPSPTATSTPTATPLATATDLPTPTPEPGVAYLPAVLKSVCLPGQKRFDVVLAIDASSSMTQGAQGQRGIDAARQAAGAFLDLLALDAGDRAAILSFNATARFEIGLSTDRVALDDAIVGITPAEGTRIDLALSVVLDELLSPRAVSENEQVVVVLTDGLQAGDGADVARRLASVMRAEGMRLFTVGLGPAVDDAFLRDLAGDPARYLKAPSTADLRAAFETIARDLPCPGGAIWSLAGDG